MKPQADQRPLRAGHAWAFIESAGPPGWRRANRARPITRSYRKFFDPTPAALSPSFRATKRRPPLQCRYDSGRKTLAKTPETGDGPGRPDRWRNPDCNSGAASVAVDPSTGSTQWTRPSRPAPGSLPSTRWCGQSRPDAASGPTVWRCARLRPAGPRAAGAGRRPLCAAPMASRARARIRVRPGACFAPGASSPAGPSGSTPEPVRRGRGFRVVAVGSRARPTDRRPPTRAFWRPAGRNGRHGCGDCRRAGIRSRGRAFRSASRPILGKTIAPAALIWSRSTSDTPHQLRHPSAQHHKPEPSPLT